MSSIQGKLPPLLENEVVFYGFYHTLEDRLITIKPRLCVKFLEFYRSSNGTSKVKFQFNGKRCRINLKRRTVDLESDHPLATDGKLRFSLIHLRDNGVYYVIGSLERGENLPPETIDKRLLRMEFVVRAACFIVAVHSDFTDLCTSLFSVAYDRECGTDISRYIDDSLSIHRSKEVVKLRQKTRECKLPVRFRVIKVGDQNFKAVNIEMDPEGKPKGFDELRPVSRPIPDIWYDKPVSDTLKSAASTKTGDSPKKIENGIDDFELKTPEIMTQTGIGNNVTTKGDEFDTPLDPINVKKTTILTGSQSLSVKDEPGWDDISAVMDPHFTPAQITVDEPTAGEDTSNKLTPGMTGKGRVIFQDKGVFCVYDEERCEFHKVDSRSFPLELKDTDHRKVDRPLVIGDHIEFTATEARLIQGEVILLKHGFAEAPFEITESEEKEGRREFDDEMDDPKKKHSEQKKEEVIHVTDEGLIISTAPSISDSDGKSIESLIADIASLIGKMGEMTPKQRIIEVLLWVLKTKMQLEYLTALCSELLPQIARDANDSLSRLECLSSGLSLGSLMKNEYDDLTGLVELGQLELYHSALMDLAGIANWNVRTLQSVRMGDTSSNPLYESVIPVEYTEECDEKDGSSERKFHEMCVDDMDRAHPLAFVARTDDASLLRSEFDELAERAVALGVGRSSDEQRSVHLAAKNILPKLVSKKDMAVINELLKHKMVSSMDDSQFSFHPKSDTFRFCKANGLELPSKTEYYCMTEESSIVWIATVQWRGNQFQGKGASKIESENDAYKKMKAECLDPRFSTKGHPKITITHLCNANDWERPKPTEFISSYSGTQDILWTAQVNWKGQVYTGMGYNKKEAETKAYQIMRDSLNL